ncbi:MAG: cupredoxin domain-containing protein [Bacillota bacterium]|nr:cupredoxin domain-containing protein [Bacillota bacterium]
MAPSRGSQARPSVAQRLGASLSPGLWRPGLTLSRREFLATVGLAVPALTLLAACGSVPANPGQTAKTTTPAGNTGAGAAPKTISVTVPGEDYFDPFIVTANAGDTVQWTNKDSDAHAVVSVPDAPASIMLTLPANQSASFKFDKAGVYNYYCNVHADYDTSMKRVKAHTDSSVFPVAMEGFVVVQGPELSQAAQQSATVEIPGKDLFEPYVVVLKQGGQVTWHNGDSDAHAVVAADNSFMLPVQAGQSVSHAFASAGTYYYYCNVHADLDSTTHEVKAHKDASAYPVAMAGLIVVV